MCESVKVHMHACQGRKLEHTNTHTHAHTHTWPKGMEGTVLLKPGQYSPAQLVLVARGYSTVVRLKQLLENNTVLHTGLRQRTAGRKSSDIPYLDRGAPLIRTSLGQKSVLRERCPDLKVHKHGV